MALRTEIESFIKKFVKDLQERNVAIFAGAGMSVARGYVDWPELLREIADELGLSVDKEKDLISIAQYHVNENAGRAGINRKILDEFTENAVPSENHRTLARLPITTFWTTNYDTLLEDAIEANDKRADVKHEIAQLANTRPKRDAVVYKMHGDKDHPAGAIITKQDYQSYYKDYEAFVTALSGDLVSKTFLFIGFSFSDPNLEYVLGRLSIQFGADSRQHYSFIKRIDGNDYEDAESFEYDKRKQELMINDLKRYKIKALLIDDYSEIEEILHEIERRFKKQTVFISGSAEEYGSWDRTHAQRLIHKLSKEIVKARFTVINGFGWGVGSAVINGALEAIAENPKAYSDDQLILRPFPQFQTGDRTLPELWEEYRRRMIPLAGIAIFVFGNRLGPDGKVIDAGGVMREFEIAFEQGLIPVPIGATGFMSKQISDIVLANTNEYYGGNEWIVPKVEELSKAGRTDDESVGIVIDIIRKLKEW